MRDPQVTTGLPAFLATLVPTWLAFGLFTSRVFLGGSTGFLVAALSIQLLFGRWVFTRALTQRN